MLIAVDITVQDDDIRLRRKSAYKRAILQHMARDHFRETTLRRDRHFDEITWAVRPTPFDRQFDRRIGGVDRLNEDLIPFVRRDTAERRVNQGAGRVVAATLMPRPSALPLSLRFWKSR